MGCSMGNTDEYAKAIQSLLAKQMREEYLRASEYEKFKKYNAKVADKQDWDGDEFKRCLKQLENEKEDTIDLSGFRPKGNPLTYPDKYVNIISNPSGRDTWADMFDEHKNQPIKKVEPFPDASKYKPMFKPYHCTEDSVWFYFEHNNFSVCCEKGEFGGNPVWFVMLGKGHKNLVDSNSGLMVQSIHNPFRNTLTDYNVVIDSDRFIFPDNKLVIETFLSIVNRISHTITELRFYDVNFFQGTFDNLFSYKVDNDLSRMRKTCYITSMKHNQKDTP